MELRKVLALRGPNIWANFPVLEAWVDLGDLNDSPSNLLPGFNERLTTWLPSLVEHRCSTGQRGGFIDRLRQGTYLAHILEHVAIELQSLAGTPVGFGRERPRKRASIASSCNTKKNRWPASAWPRHINYVWPRYTIGRSTWRRK